MCDDKWFSGEGRFNSIWNENMVLYVLAWVEDGYVASNF